MYSLGYPNYTSFSTLFLSTMLPKDYLVCSCCASKTFRRLPPFARLCLALDCWTLALNLSVVAQQLCPELFRSCPLPVSQKNFELVVCGKRRCPVARCCWIRTIDWLHDTFSKTLICHNQTKTRPYENFAKSSLSSSNWMVLVSKTLLCCSSFHCRVTRYSIQ